MHASYSWMVSYVRHPYKSMIYKIYIIYTPGFGPLTEKSGPLCTPVVFEWYSIGATLIILWYMRFILFIPLALDPLLKRKIQQESGA